MSENLATARCSQEEYEMARNAGILVITAAEEMAVHKFAESIRQKNATDMAKAVDALCELCALMQETIAGRYTPDSFTTQPAIAALAELGRRPG